ncbi:MAG TPA: hypothetical protein VFE61_29675 [Candidatus Sulfotelmatobacter sp.]|jgi:hypothetical protein|nr:hypothetical protein [Candidatus Sulfotelmatobacter sp.]
MPDWKQLVRERMESAAPSAGQDVISELAAHLEEVYENFRLRGLTEASAIELTLQEVDNWRVLAAKIRQAKSEGASMNHRTRSFWLPVLISLGGASVSLLLIQLTGMEPRLIWIDLRHIFPASSPLYGKIGMTVYWPWLASLPFFGALGAYLSRRSQGNTPVRLLAGLSPALIMLVVMCMILPFSLALDGLSLFQLVVFGFWGLFNWVAIPAVALLLGALPFLKQQPAKA